MHRKIGPDNAFHFKQFHISHDRCAMKVGTDGVLLGAWSNVHNAKQILDIGTGTGLISLMLAQRSDEFALIDGVEIDEAAFQQAAANVKASPWPHKVHIHHTSIQQFRTDKNYDLIVSNPPFFANSLRPPNEQRNRTRHNDELPFSELTEAAKRHLKPSGRFCVILPREEGNSFIQLAAKSYLFCNQKVAIKYKQSKPIERYLLEFSFTSNNRIEYELLLSNEEGNWTETYRKIVAPFYLWA